MKCPMCGKRAGRKAGGRWRCKSCGVSGYYGKGADGMLVMLVADWGAEKPDRPEELEYCAVCFSEGGRPYSYLAGGLRLRPGDEVTVPVGKNDSLKTAVVVSVGKYTRENAPYPPEMTKTVHALEKTRGVTAPVRRLIDMLRRRGKSDV